MFQLIFWDTLLAILVLDDEQAIPQYGFLWFRNDGTEFGGSVYQKVNNQLETAVTLAWTAGSNNTRFGIAAKYQLDSDASLSVS